MKRITKWKKIIFAFVVVLVVVRILYIGIRGEVDKEYYTSTVYDFSGAVEIPCQDISVSFISSQGRLDSLELFFGNIAEDRTGVVILSLYEGEVLIYQTNISLSNISNQEWKKIFVNADMRQGITYTITLHANETCTQIPTVFVVDEAAGEIIQSCQNAAVLEGNVAVNFGYLREPGILDRFSVISLWVMFVFAVFAVLYSFERITSCLRKGYACLTKSVTPGTLLAVSEVLAGMVIINSSGIEFQGPTKVILYAVSLVSVVNYKVKRSYVSELIDKPVKRVFLYFCYFYAAFALVGQRILIYPLTLKVTAAGLLVLMVTVFWFIPVVDSLLYYLDFASRHTFGKVHKINMPVFLLVCTSILLLPAVYNLLANNPGISSVDTVDCMITNAQHLHGMVDWHPAFYCMVLRVIEEIWNSTYAVIIVQYFFWAYVMDELLLFLRKRGMNDGVLVSVAVFSGCNAANFLHLNTIWKDIPYTLSLLWAFVILAKLSIYYEEYKHKLYIYLEFIISMVGICLYRKNGMVSFIIIAVAAVIILRKNVKVWLSAVIALALVFVVKGPVYDYFEVRDSGRFGIYIGLGQDILGVYYAGGEVSEETLQMITMMTEYNNAEYGYTPTWSMAAYDVDVSPTEFIKSYLDTFVKNPVLMTRAVIAREDALWNIFAGQDATLGCVNFYGTMDGTELWNTYYPERRYVSLYTRMSEATGYTASSQWISAIIWRCGLFTLLGLIAVAYAVFRKGSKNYLLALSPIAGHIMSLLLSTGWSDFRYYWPLNLMNLSWILIVLAARKVGQEKKD